MCTVNSSPDATASRLCGSQSSHSLSWSFKCLLEGPQIAWPSCVQFPMWSVSPAAAKKHTDPRLQVTERGRAAYTCISLLCFLNHKIRASKQVAYLNVQYKMVIWKELCDVATCIFILWKHFVALVCVLVLHIQVFCCTHTEIKARKSFHTKHKSSCYSSLGINDKSQSFYLPSAIMQDSFSIAAPLRCWICIVSLYMVLVAKKKLEKKHKAEWVQRQLRLAQKSRMNWIKPRCWLIVTFLNLTPLELRRKKAEKQQIKMGSFSSSHTLYQLTCS